MQTMPSPSVVEVTATMMNLMADIFDNHRDTSRTCLLSSPAGKLPFKQGTSSESSQTAHAAAAEPAC